MWFRDSKQSIRFNRLKHFLEFKDVIRLTKKICKRKNIKEEEVISHTKDGIYVMQHLTLSASSYLNDTLFYDIYDFYLASKPAKVQKQVRQEAILLLKDLEIKLNQDIR